MYQVTRNGRTMYFTMDELPPLPYDEEMDDIDNDLSVTNCSKTSNSAGSSSDHQVSIRSSLSCNPYEDLCMIFPDFESRYEEVPVVSLVCPHCHQNLKEKSNSSSYYGPCQKVLSGLFWMMSLTASIFSGVLAMIGGPKLQLMSSSIDQAEKVIIEDNINVDEENEMLVNPFEIDNIVEIILKNMKNVEDLKNSRLISNVWNRNAVKVLSTPSRQAKIKPKSFLCSTEISGDDFKKENQLLKNSENIKIFRKFQFYFQSSSRESIITYNDYQNQLFEIIEITNPTDINIMFDYKCEIDFTLFSKFLHKISQNVVQLKIDLFLFRDEKFLIEEESLHFEFPKLKTLEIVISHGPYAIGQKTFKFVKLLLKNCHFLDNINISEFKIDEFLPDLLTPEIAQNLQKLQLSRTAFGFERIEPHIKSIMNLKSFKVDSGTILLNRILNFPELKSFLTSQSQSLEKFTIHFNFSEGINFYDDGEFQPIVNGLEIPRLENLKTLKLKYNWSINQRQFLPVKRINLPEFLPSLKKIEISYDPQWKMCFMADKSCETVQELVLEKWSKENMFIQDLISIFPKIKYLKMNFRDYPGEEEMQANLSSIEGWSSTLKMIDVQCERYFPQNFSFQELNCLPNLEHLYLHQEKTEKQNENEIRPDFTSLFNMKKLSKLIIENIKIPDDVIKELFDKFPNLDYTTLKRNVY